MSRSGLLSLLLTLSIAGACSQAETGNETSSPRADAPSANASAMSSDGATSIEQGSNGTAVINQDEKEITINGDGTTQTKACTGQIVQLFGNGNHATFTGTSKGLYIVGKGNEVALENVKVIQVTGDDNKVSWKGTEPQIANIGKGNVIAQAQ